MIRLIAILWLAAHVMQSAELQVGVAKIDITPDMPVALGGYGNAQNRIYEGVHDRLYARAIAFKGASKRLVLVSCDLSGFPYGAFYSYQKAILNKFNLAPDELFLCGTHTHSAPMLILNRTYPHPNNFKYTEALKPMLVELVGKALNATAPARIGGGVGHSPIAVNRRVPIPAGEVSAGGSRVKMGRNPDGPVDREVRVLKITRPDGAPVASMFNYACHSRSLNSANKLMSGDIFGIAEQLVENTLGKNVVGPAFSGASGDVDPWYVLPGFDTEPGWISETVLMGHMLGQEVVRVFRNVTALAPAGDLRTRTERLALPGKAGGAPTANAEAPTRYVQLTVAAIGDIAFVGLDCEALVEIGLAIKAGSPFRHTFIITNCNGEAGYLPPAHLYPERGYEVDASGYAPQAAGMVVQGALKMLASLRLRE